ncbi:hypothetical protein HN51_058115 [Arachis hypogaea]|nr:uncharacterized protein DS421_20g685570 [Arachis hypogaea]
MVNSKITILRPGSNTVEFPINEANAELFYGKQVLSTVCPQDAKVTTQFPKLGERLAKKNEGKIAPDDPELFPLSSGDEKQQVRGGDGCGCSGDEEQWQQ